MGLGIKKFFGLWLTMALLLSACNTGPKDDPSNVLSAYYQSVIDGDFIKAYNMHTEAYKQRNSQEDFSTYMNTLREFTTLSGSKVEKIKEEKNREVEGKKYRRVVELSVVEQIKDLVSNKDTTSNYIRLVVSEGDQWMLHRDGDIKQSVADNLAFIGSMYMFGEGKEVNVNEAIKYYKKSLEYVPNDGKVQNVLAAAYLGAKRMKEAAETAQAALVNAKDNLSLSEVHNVLGLIAEEGGNFNDAKMEFEKAVELNPDNEYAKTNLARISKNDK